VNVRIHHLFISPGHNFFGHHGQPAGENPTVEVPSLTCRAGHGVEGDRFFDYKENYAGQITFFSWDIYQSAKQTFAVPALSAGAFRRNVVIDGVDINTLIGRRFVLGGVEFEGTVESKPCYWMEQAVGPGVRPSATRCRPSTSGRGADFSTARARAFACSWSMRASESAERRGGRPS